MNSLNIIKKYFIGSKSNKISEIINDLEKNNKEVLERLVRELDTEISTLLPNYEEVNLICLGEKATSWAKKFLSDEQSRFSNLEKEYKVYQIYHHSFFASTARKNMPKNITLKIIIQQLSNIN